jgi:hypothetical protein
MPGVRDKNLRSGDLHEDLGLLLLKAVALVAPVPRQEDVGNDAFATLIRPEGGRRLIPDLSFLVQLKSSSVKSVKYVKPDEMAWLRQLEDPLFIGRVHLRRARIELFTTLRLHHILLEHGYDGVELLLDPAAEFPTQGNVRRANLGLPIHSWSLAEMKHPDFPANAYQVLRPHVYTLRLNLSLRGIQTQIMLQWETGKPPTDNGEMMNVKPGSDIANTLRNMAPHVRRLLMEMQLRKRYADFPVLLAFVNLMERWGGDPDPMGIARLIAGFRAGGPNVSVTDAILMRSAVRPPYLDLTDLAVTDETLAVIPPDVTKLVVVDVPVTDTGIRHLLRLTGLTRLNISGTKVTDEGLRTLAGLSHLEFVNVHHTAVTIDGVNRLRATRPRITVLSDHESGPEESQPKSEPG